MRRVLLGIILPLSVLTAWWLVGTLSPGARGVISTPPDVVTAFVQSIESGKLWIDIGVSLSRALGGWALALLVAAPLGIAMARVSAVRVTLGPLFNVLRPISPVAWIPVAILWFGIGYGSKVFIVGIISFFVILANAFHAAASIDPALLKAVKTFTRSRWRTTLHVVLPASFRGVATGAQFALSSAWGGVIIAEYTGANSGVGYEMLHSANLFLPARVMASMVTVAIIGYLLNALVKWALRTRLGRKYVQ